MLAPLAGNPNVLAKDASSLINVTLNGTGDLVINGVPSPFPMPGFAAVLDDQQIADVLSFVRAGWNNGAPAVGAAFSAPGLATRLMRGVVSGCIRRVGAFRSGCIRAGPPRVYRRTRRSKF